MAYLHIFLPFFPYRVFGGFKIKHWS